MSSFGVLSISRSTMDRQYIRHYVSSASMTGDPDKTRSSLLDLDNTQRDKGEGEVLPEPLEDVERTLLNMIEELQSMECNKPELPQIVVIGDQSSGKSSVLNALARIPFPRDAGPCTRFATEIRLIPDKGPTTPRNQRLWRRFARLADSDAIPVTVLPDPMRAAVDQTPGELPTSSRSLRSTMGTKRVLASILEAEFFPRQAANPPRYTDRTPISKHIDMVDVEGQRRSLEALISSRLKRSLIHPDVVQRLGLDTAYTRRERLLPSSCPGGRDERQESWKKNLLTISRGVARMARDLSLQVPLALGATSAYFMGRAGRSGPSGYRIAQDSTGGINYSGDPLQQSASPTSLVLAAIAMTSFSLTAHHYILVQQQKDRDFLVFGFVGAGVVAGSLAGLDGITILLRVAPWCAIAAFFLCALVLPPRVRPIEIFRGTPGTVSPEQGTIQMPVSEKEDMFSRDSNLMAASETEMPTRGLPSSV